MIFSFLLLFFPGFARAIKACCIIIQKQQANNRTQANLSASKNCITNEYIESHSFQLLYGGFDFFNHGCYKSNSLHMHFLSKSEAMRSRLGIKAGFVHSLLTAPYIWRTNIKETRKLMAPSIKKNA